MLKRMVLSSLMIFVLITSTVFADDFQVQPDKIVLNSIRGTAETVKFSYPLYACAEGVSVDVDEGIFFNDVQSGIAPMYVKYCVIDDILHIYFDKDEVIDFLRDTGIEGDVDIYFDGAIIYGDPTDGCSPVSDTGSFYGTVEVVNPSKKDSK